MMPKKRRDGHGFFRLDNPVRRDGPAAKSRVMATRFYSLDNPIRRDGPSTKAAWTLLAQNLILLTTFAEESFFGRSAITFDSGAVCAALKAL